MCSNIADMSLHPMSTPSAIIPIAAGARHIRLATQLVWIDYMLIAVVSILSLVVFILQVIYTHLVSFRNYTAQYTINNTS